MVSTDPGRLRPRVTRGLAATGLALLLGLQPVSTDVYLPSLPQLTQALGASMSGAQMTMAALLLGFGLAQLFWGPVADRFGRRPVLLLGLGLYTLCGAAAALAPGIGSLIAARAVQGACMAAAVVCARAMVRDLYEPQEGARVMSMGLTGLGVIALLGPSMGGLATMALGWRGTLWVVTAFGAAVLGFVAWRLPETIGQRNPQATRLGPMASAWRALAVHPRFVAWTLLSAGTYGGLYVILAASSFVYIGVLGLSALGYGLVLASNSLAYIAGTVLCRGLVARFGLVGAVRRGAVLTLAGGSAITVLALAFTPSLWTLLVPQWLFMLGHGVQQPVAQAAAVGPFPRQAGAASALSGFVQAVVAFLIGLTLGRVLDHSALPLALGLGLAAGVTGSVALWLAPRAERRAQPPRDAAPA